MPEKSTRKDNDQLPLPQLPQLLKVDDVCKAFNIKRTTVYKMIEDETFVRPIKVGKRSSRWPINDVQRIYDARCNGAKGEQVRQLVRKIHDERAQRLAAA